MMMFVSGRRRTLAYCHLYYHHHRLAFPGAVFILVSIHGVPLAAFFRPECFFMKIGWLGIVNTIQQTCKARTEKSVARRGETVMSGY